MSNYGVSDTIQATITILAILAGFIFFVDSQKSCNETTNAQKQTCITQCIQQARRPLECKMACDEIR